MSVNANVWQYLKEYSDGYTVYGEGGGRDRVGEKAKIRVQKIPWTIDEKTVKTGI